MLQKYSSTNLRVHKTCESASNPLLLAYKKKKSLGNAYLIPPHKYPLGLTTCHSYRINVASGTIKLFKLANQSLIFKYKLTMNHIRYGTRDKKHKHTTLNNQRYVKCLML